MRRFLLSALLFLPLLACTPKQVPGPSDGATGDAAAAWNAYSARTRTEEATARPFRLSASLRYTDNKGESTRVSSLFWGNGRTPYPLRLDLTAGVGTVVAKIRENNDNFTAYNPDEKTAYFHTRENRALSAFGVPIPLTLLDLSLILTGRGGTLFLPPVGETPSAETGPGGYVFRIQNAPLAGLLELSPQGVPVSWRQGGWTLAFEPESDDPMRPHRVRITNSKGQEALIVVRSLDFPPMPFAGAQLELPLPPGTQTKELPEQGL